MAHVLPGRPAPPITAAATLVLVLASAGPRPAAAAEPAWIAHAGGAVDGMPMTNSLEALDASYGRGFRWFEIDLCWSADGRLVAIHDWRFTWRTFGGGGARPSAAAFAATPLAGGLTPLTLERVLAWLADHPDARLITDVKRRNRAGLRLLRRECSARGVCPQVVPQIYAMSQHAAASALGFDQVVLTLYRRLLLHPGGPIARYARRRAPLAIAMPDWLFTGRPLGARLQRQGTPVWIHTVDDEATLRDLCSAPTFPDGVFTDDLLLGDPCGR